MATHRPKNAPVYKSLWGSFGKFRTGVSYPIEYLLTTVPIADLDLLNTAQEVRSETRDFELLMQRDIDMDRVRKQIIKYLSPAKTEAELRARPTFFPPLLAAIIPVNGRNMSKYLPAEVVREEEDSEEGNLLVRDWGGILRFRFVPDLTGPLAYTPFGGEEKHVRSFPVQVQFKHATSTSIEPAVRLVIIDGQHRLQALRELAHHSAEDVQDIDVPVCLINSPNSTLDRATHQAAQTLPIPNVFRELFVDVNKNALAVGGHFNSLLSDSTIGNLAVRSFCDTVLKIYGENGLALVEWNIRTQKDATQITRKYSVTSIGVIEKALAKALGSKKNNALLKRVLSLGLIEADLYPQEFEYEYPNPVSWDRFSPGQKQHLAEQVRKELVEKGLIPIFFKSEPFAVLREQFEASIAELERTISEKGNQFTEIKTALLQIVDYVPIGKDNNAAQTVLNQIEGSIARKYEAKASPILHYSVFQRALIHAWLDFVDLVRADDELSLENMTAGFVALMNGALKPEGSHFSRDRRYMVHSVFRVSGQIKPSEGTRKALSALLLAFMGAPRIHKDVLAATGISSDSALAKKLSDSAFERATHFLIHFKSQRRDDFEASWLTDFSLSQEERERMEQVNDALNEAKRKYRDQQIDKATMISAEEQFSRVVSHFVSTDVDLAASELRGNIGFATDIVLDSASEEIEEEEDE